MPDDSLNDVPELSSTEAIEARLAALEHAIGDILKRLDEVEARVEATNQRLNVAEATITAQNKSQGVAFDAITDLREWAARKLAELAAATPAAPDASVTAAHETAETPSEEPPVPGENPEILGIEIPGTGPDPARPPASNRLGDFSDILIRRDLDGDKPLIFTHVPKCAGNTINATLKHVAELSGTRNLTISGATSKFGLRETLPQLLADSGLSLDQFRFIGGHLPFSNFRDNADAYNFILSVRNPVERALSDIISQPAFPDSPDAIFANVVEEVKKRPPHTEFLIDNLHVRMLANDPQFGNRCTLKMLREAIANIKKHYRVVFSSQNTAVAREIICRHQAVPGFTTENLNVTDEKPEVPQDVIDALHAHNCYDIELLDQLQYLSDTQTEANAELKQHVAAQTSASNIPKPSPTVPVDDPQVPPDWNSTAPEVVITVNLRPAVRTSWVEARAAQA